MPEGDSPQPDNETPTVEPPRGESLGDRLMATLRQALGLRSPENSARAEIEDALAEDEAFGAPAFAPEERAMLRAILKFGEMRVDDVMLPRADIEAVEVGASLAQVLARFRESGHSRMPVYRDTLDDPLGMVLVKDVMGWVIDRAALRGEGEAPDRPAYDLGAVDLSSSLESTGLVRPLLFVPPSMPARTLLAQMQAGRIQMALVIDEYGGTDGLVSLEDLVEVIVGEIEDEHDEDEEAEIVRAADGSWIVDARVDLEELAREIGPGFRVDAEADVDTLGGLVFTALGRIPVRGERVQALEGFEFEILDSDPRRVKRIRIRERRRPKLVRAAERAGAAEPGYAPPSDARPDSPPGKRSA